ncbi:MAG: TetR family transcriptional regulator [Alphaproteobacteria bacterium]|nr:TetR family transcriptional regulator [Alphaproteobacteria bacterium]MCW5742018.1 TetR family transcriptional regulator [Alphaproteobacteria bacterium]
MARPRADDYDAKYQAILDAAAVLFAEVGYPNAKMQNIAERCGATKSMLYHYFPTKDELLQAMLSEHLERLIQEIAQASGGPGTVEERFFRLVQAYVEKSAQSRQRHISAMNDVRFLPVDMQQPLRRLQKRSIEVVAALLAELNPTLPAELRKPYALMLLGLLNWTDLWYKPRGRIKPRELCARISRLFLNGFLDQRTAMPGLALVHEHSEFL